MRTSWVLGIAGLVLLTVVVLNTLQTEGPGSRGVPAGEAMPPFAAPLALSALEGDANVATRADSGAEGAVPACSVRSPDVLNVCALWERGPVALAFFATRSEACEDQIDVLDSVDVPGASVAAVAVRGEREEVRRVVRERGWRLPVGYDHDGAVANLYAVAVCPTITFARRGGEVVSTSLRSIGAAEIRRRLEAAR